ncbi:MAG: sulfotransferase [Cyanobacteria bacterium P01_G01_bin.39]
MKKTVFIIALPRSGTSWLQGMLASLPEIATVRETHLVDNYLRNLVKAWNSERKQPAPDGLRAILTEAEFYNCIKGFSDRVLAKISEFNPSAEIILEKTPGNLNFVDLLNRLYPEAYFIHVIRDPRAVVASFLALKQEKWGWINPGENHFDIARKWVRGMEKRDRAAQLLQSRFLEVRYEDMKHDQNAVLQKICNFLSLDYTCEQLQELIPHVSASDLDRTKANFPLQNPFFDTRANFFRRGEIDSWKQELTTEQIIEVEAVCICAMTKHKYQPQHLKII